MSTIQLTDKLPHKHRATRPIPAAERPAATQAHRAGREAGLPIAAILGIIVLILAAYFALRG